MDARKINLASCYHVESTSPGWDGVSSITIHGRSPGGQLIAVTVTVSAVALGYMGREIRKGLLKHEEAVQTALRRASGEEQ